MQTEELIAQLRQHLAFRHIRQGRELLEDHRSQLESLNPASRGAGVLLGLTAQWVDAGARDPGLVREMLRRLPQCARDSLLVNDYLHVRMAEGMLAAHDEELEQAIAHFQFAISLEGESRDAEALAIANFWNGRCLRSLGRYDDAAGFAARGRSLALECGYRPMAAVIRLLESWLSFQKGRLQEAARILQEAEAALASSDDHITAGNIHSAYGRIARRQGRYAEALDRFERANIEYCLDDPEHRHLARSLVNMAFVERLVALEDQHEIDRESARRRSEAAAGPGMRARRERIGEMRATARCHLERAMAIFERYHHHRGTGSALINLGLLDLDGGDLESAEAHATAAFQQGEEKHDAIVMARARTLRCMVENARLEEGIGDEMLHARLAIESAREAIEYATRTQNRRLLARASVWEGLTWTVGPHRDLDAAKRCCEQARRLLKTDSREREYVWDDLERLQSRVMQPVAIAPLLEAWSEGLVEGKTFQQITEEFAGLLVPKVWEREGRKVSRVASKLSMSPKKVRRILRDAGVERAGSSATGQA